MDITQEVNCERDEEHLLEVGNDSKVHEHKHIRGGGGTYSP
jgi:hypothetical protein